MDDASKTKVLGECGFFEGLQIDHIAQVAKLCRKVQLGAGQEVFRQGEEGKDLYLLCEGRVCLERATNLGGRQGKVVVALLDAGKLFGAWCVLLGEGHGLMTTAVCKSDATMVVLDGGKLRELILADQDFGFQVLERLGLLLRERLSNVLVAMETM